MDICWRLCWDRHECKYTDCVDVCPVDCFKEGGNFLVIDPGECIDCAVCIPECPVDAIYAEDDLPPELISFTELNTETAPLWNVITKRKLLCLSPNTGQTEPTNLPISIDNRLCIHIFWRIIP